MDGSQSVFTVCILYRSNFTAVPAALLERWNLPRPKKHATGIFFTSLRSAGLSIP